MLIDLQAQVQAYKIFDGLGVEYALMEIQNGYPETLRYRMFAHNFRYSGVFCRIVVTVYAEKPLELIFCASGRNPMNGYDEVDMADNAQDLLAVIPETITRAKDVERQENHEMQQPKWNGRTQADGGAVSGLAHRRRNH